MSNTVNGDAPAPAPDAGSGEGGAPAPAPAGDQPAPAPAPASAEETPEEKKNKLMEAEKAKALKDASDENDSDLAAYNKIKKTLGGNDKTVAAYLAARQAFSKSRAEAQAKADAAVAKATPSPSDTSGGPAGDPEPVDSDLEEYKKLKEQLGSDDNVSKYLAARKEMASAKAASLVSPELVKAQSMMKYMGPLDLGLTDQSGKLVNARSVPTGWGPQYIKEEPWNVTVPPVDNPTTLDGAKWDKIIRINKTLFGFIIREQEQDIVKARFPGTVVASVTRINGLMDAHVQRLKSDHVDLSLPATPAASTTAPTTILPPVPQPLGAPPASTQPASTQPAGTQPAGAQPASQPTSTTANGGQPLTPAGVLSALASQPPPSNYVFPEYEVYDGSSISIKETSTSLQKSLAENGFSAHSVETAVSGGSFGISAGISAGLREQSSSGVAQTDADASKEYYATYNFPRCRIYMDELNLEVTPQCAQALQELLDVWKKMPTDIDNATTPASGAANTAGAADGSAAAASTDAAAAPEVKQEQLDKWNDMADQMLQKFSARYGHVFATQYSLGGQLKSSKFASSIYSSTDTAKFDALKTAAAMSFSSMYVSASAKYSYEQQSDEKTSSQSNSSTSQLAWTARGGNTLLCANPPSWAGTVGGHETWRVLEQESVLTLHELLGRFDAWKDVPRAFEDIGKRRLKVKEAQAAATKGTWKNSIKLKITDTDGTKYRLAHDPDDAGTLVTVKDDGTSKFKEPVFKVANAVYDQTMSTAGDVMSQLQLSGLYADFPLFLVCGDTIARDKSRGWQVPDLWVTKDGKLRPETSLSTEGPTPIMRWSLRRAGPPGTPLQYSLWKPRPRDPIANGDSVYVFCHSLNFGFYRSDSRPPDMAAPIHWNPQQQRIAVFGLTAVNGPGVRKESLDYDQGGQDRSDAGLGMRMSSIVRFEGFPNDAILPIVKQWGYTYVRFTVEYA